MPDVSPTATVPAAARSTISVATAFSSSFVAALTAASAAAATLIACALSASDATILPFHSET